MVTARKAGQSGSVGALRFCAGNAFGSELWQIAPGPPPRQDTRPLPLVSSGAVVGKYKLLARQRDRPTLKTALCHS